MTRDINPPRTVWSALPYPQVPETVTTMAVVLDTVTRLTRERNAALADVASRDAEIVALRMTHAVDLSDAITLIAGLCHRGALLDHERAMLDMLQDRLTGSEAGSWAEERSWYVTAWTEACKLLARVRGGSTLDTDELALVDRIVAGPGQ